MSETKKMLSADEALELLLSHARPIAEVESIHTTHALGRVLAEPLVSSVTVPPLDNSAMDGYAMACASLNSVGETRLRVAQRIPAGQRGPCAGSWYGSAYLYRCAGAAGCGCRGDAGRIAALEGDAVVYVQRPDRARISVVPARILLPAARCCLPA